MKFKRKKATKLRGHTTHGYGSMKKHRGAGNRGGRGNAGTGKRGDVNKPSIWHEKKYFGKYGFTSKISKNIKSINISYLHEKSSTFEKKGDTFIVDLKKLGYDKLLGSGKIKDKFEIKAKSASKSAVEKVEKAGGKVITEAAEE